LKDTFFFSQYSDSSATIEWVCCGGEILIDQDGHAFFSSLLGPNGGEDKRDVIVKDRDTTSTGTQTTRFVTNVGNSTAPSFGLRPSSTGW